MYPDTHVRMFPWGIQRSGIGRGCIDPQFQMTNCFQSGCTNLHSHQLNLSFHLFRYFCDTCLILSDFS